MLIDREGDTLAEGEPDPATPGRRAELARMLLVSAIRHYRDALERWANVEASYPNLPGPSMPDDAENAERRDWRRLLREVDDDFDSAELALASRIQGLFDLVAPEGRRVRDEPAEYFIPRAVRHAGSVYVLADDVGRYEPRANFVAVFREPMVIDVAGEAIADDL